MKKSTVKRVLKRTVGFAAAVMTAVCGSVPTFAVSGIIPKADEEVSYVTAFKSDGTDLSFFSDNSGDTMAVSNDSNNGAIQMGTQYKLSSGNYYAQSYTRDLPTAEDGKLAGLSFKVMADSENNSSGETDKLYITAGSGSSYKETTEVFALDQKGNIGIPLASGSADTTGWPNNIGASAMKTSYKKGVWYNVGLVLDTENGMTTAYVDGVNLGTAKLGKPDRIKNGDLRFMLHVEGAETAKFYIDDISWITDTARLTAAAEQSTIEKSGTAYIDFSAIIRNKDLANEVKVFKCADGEQVTASASFDAVKPERLNVEMTGAEAEGAEYRVELPNFIDVFGNELYNNSVYVSIGIPAGQERIIDVCGSDFSDYTSTENYSAPSGWTKSYQWQSGGFKNVYMQPQADTENGVAVLLKKDALSSSGNDLWTSGGMYMALPYKISSGAVTISYDFKPIKYRRGGNNSQSNDELWETNFAMGVYTDIPSSTTAAVDANYFSVLQAVKKTQIGFAKKRISPEYDKWGTAVGPYWHTYEELDTDDFPWDLKEDVTIENPKWYSIEIKLNFDKNTVEYYVDGEKQAESNTLMNEIGTYSSGTLTNPVSDGIVGIGFGIGTQPLYTEQMIDNIRVIRSLPELGDPVDDFSGDFSDYTDSAQYSAPSGWTKSYQWQAGGFNNVYLQPQADTVSGTAVLLKKDALSSTGNDLWTSGGMYMALPSRISSGTVSIGYDIKPIKYKRGGDLTNDKVWETNFAVGVYADLPSDTTAAVSGDYLSVLQAVKKTQLGFAKKRISPESDNWTDSGSGPYWYTGCELDADGSPWNMGEVLTVADPKWYRIELLLDFDQRLIEYYVDGVKQGESTTLMDEIGTYSSGALANPISNGIVGVGIGIGTTARYSEQLIDNITISHRGIKAIGGVSAVRFSDCAGDMYGAAPSLTTLTDTIAVSFLNTPDADSVNASTVKLLKNGTEVPYTGSIDADTGSYIMNLDGLLDRNSDYVLRVDGVTVGGVAVAAYEQQIHTEENGRFIAEPIRIYLNDTEAQSGTILEGNKIKADVSLIDTTGDEKNYNFSMVLYNGDTLSKVDFIDFSMGGTDGTKVKTAECEFTIDAQDVQNLTKIKAFLWSGMDKLTPIMIPAEFTVTR